MSEKKNKPNLPKLPKYCRAFDFIMSNPNLRSAEKLILTAIARHYPNPCWQSNQSLAADCGFIERRVERWLARLKEHNPPYIIINYQHTKNRKGKQVTKRTIIVNSGALEYDKKLLKTELMPGKNRPNNPSGINQFDRQSGGLPTDTIDGQSTVNTDTPLLKDQKDIIDYSGSNSTSPGKRSNPSNDKKEKDEGKAATKQHVDSMDLIVQAFDKIPDNLKAELKIEKMPVKPLSEPMSKPLSEREFMDRVAIQRAAILSKN